MVSPCKNRLLDACPSVWCSKAGPGPKNLHFQQVPRWPCGWFMEYTLWTQIQGTVVQWTLGGDHDLGSNPWSTISLLYSPWTHSCPCLQVTVFFTSFLLCQYIPLTLGYSLPGISSSSGVIHFPPQRLHPRLRLEYIFWLPFMWLTSSSFTVRAYISHSETIMES